jgi:23S rRNA pseudouridine2605 synthase|tara:strand:+ start:3931 stop:4656 length:726 start_codon:yes stop_codon:yes gene_type:complete
MDSTEVRLQKYLADQGIASRRQAETFIEEGRVRVNGQRAKLGTKVTAGKDEVVFDGNLIGHIQQKPVVLALNKPKGLLCSHRDPYHKRTIYDLIPPPFSEQRLFCAGRLDKESEGLIIITNDGALVHRLTHPSSQIIKRYKVTLDKDFNEKHTRNLLEGITWEGERLKVEKVLPDRHVGCQNQLELHLHHGKKREIRRLMVALGYDVQRLQRFQIGNLGVKGISKGQVKVLRKSDIDRLFN